MANSVPINLSTSTPNRKRLSFCAPTVSAVEVWANELPLANMGLSAKMLYDAIPQINTLMTKPEHRFSMLEALRIRIQMTIELLSKHFLHQPIILSEKSLKVATLAQALQKHLTNGYKLVAVELMNANASTARNAILRLAIYHAIKSSTYFLLRYHQLYMPPPPNVWKEMHSLYLLAEQRELVTTELVDEGNRFQTHSNIVTAYLRALLLGCSKPNQLNQDNLEKLFHALELWVSHVDFHQNLFDKQQSLFIISMDSDAPPFYRAQADAPEDDTYRYINTYRLAENLSNHLSNKESQLTFPIGFSDELSEHLVRIWGAQQTRSFHRIHSKGSTKICIGLSEIHYQIAGESDFNMFLNNTNGMLNNEMNNPFLSRGSSEDDLTTNDVWGEVKGGKKIQFHNEINVSTKSIEQTIKSSARVTSKLRHSTYLLNCVNTSPGGYCLETASDPPPEAKPGEVIGIYEQNGIWNLGIVKWLRKVSKGVQLGVKLICPNAVPLGAAVIQKTESKPNYVRALLIPEINVINQTATLLTAQIVFQVGNKVTIKNGDKESIIRLTKRTTITGCINQFEFKYLSDANIIDANDGVEGTGEDHQFNNLWKDL